MKAKTEPREQAAVELSPRDYALLVATCNVQSHTGSTKRMRRFAQQMAQEYGARSHVDHGNLYIAKGDATVYPCFVAHLDTVHRIRDSYTVYKYDNDDLTAGYLDNDGRLVETGIGGDDKCGIMIALAMLRDLPACKVALFRDEEHGCIGAQLATMRWFDDCQYAIECDRRGSSDIVRDAAGVELHGDGFAAAIEPAADIFGFSDSWGSLTDVMTLKESGLKVAACNLSAGYYDPHMPHETIRPGDVARTLELCRTIARDTAGIMFPHEYAYPQYTSWRSYKYERQPYDWRSATTAGICPDCKESYCGIPIETETTALGFCPTCRAYTVDPWRRKNARNEAPTHREPQPNTCPQCHDQTVYDKDERAEFCMMCCDYTYNLYQTA